MSHGLPLLPHFFQRFIQNWADRRQPAPHYQVTVDHRHLYILPTRHGIAFALILLLILFGAINYENSLAFMLAFLLGSLCLLGMIYTHQNINRLQIRVGRPEPVFVGQDILFPLTVSQSEPRLRGNIQLQAENDKSIHLQLIDGLSTDCKLPLKAVQRGYISARRIRLFSEYPLGLFYAWSWLNLRARCLVYPAPDTEHHPLSASSEKNTGELSSHKSGVDDFAGIREYRAGDPASHMAWKAIARTGVLQTILFNSDVSQDVCISWWQTAETLDTEKRLSILCRMVLDASEQSIRFALEIPGSQIAAGSGRQHKHRCLKALALFGQQ